LFNGSPSAITANQVVNPTLGVWRAITTLSPCNSDTSLPFTIVSAFDKVLEKAPTVFPNPATDNLTLTNAQGYTRFEIADILGRTLQTGMVKEAIRVDALSKSVYFLKLMGGSRKTTVIRFEKR
jgi:hypothetical protein